MFLAGGAGIGGTLLAGTSDAWSEEGGLPGLSRARQGLEGGLVTAQLGLETLEQARSGTRASKAVCWPL